ncbi:molecular chaperone HtpG [Eubacteriales bacterium OttesenSCG-928-K08]|nr:molecular chaperone HtpG [Eubacteriales bacterium OttesenSCG-928-K08]
MQPFKAESKRLLDLMINSIYTHKEIFLRELISNASDAIDKLYYRELDEGTVGLSKEDYFIYISADEENRTLTISDNGIGMTKDELELHLGTIADSGTLRFREEQNNAEIESIGQFGVGFYSAFMVAQKVNVVSRVFNSDEAWQWESEGVEGFTISPAEKQTQGTTITLVLKEDTDDENYGEFLEQYRLQSLIKKYSDYIRYPIKMELSKSRPVEQEENAPEDAPKYESYTEIETINSMIPLWKRSKSDITKEMYDQFYKEKFMDYEAPLKVVHTSAEGAVSYHALLFFPGRAPYDYYTKEFEKGLQLYSSGVLIMDKCADLLPDHFSFVKGLVDSPDLSLNISRELLQHDRQLKVIAGNIEKKIKNELMGLLTSERETYEKLWVSFGLQLKFGAYSNFGMKKELLQDLLLFHSMKENNLITLREYRDAMPEAQKAIYYASGQSVERINQLPQLDALSDHGYDVLFLTDDVDEFVMQVLESYDEKQFQSISGQDLELGGDEEKEAAKEQSEEHKKLLDALGNALSGQVKAVRLSTRLKRHAVCLSTDGALSIEMEKVLNSMPTDQKVKAERVLELNPTHAVFEKLTDMDINDTERVNAYAQILYAQAQLLEGILPDDPIAYSEAVMNMMAGN